MLGLQYFTFWELWNPWQMALTVAIGVVYLWLTGPMRSRFPGSEPVRVSRKVVFLIGIAAYYFAHGGPLNLLGHLMFSAHMASMSVAYMVAPPLILLGIPGWMVRPLVGNKVVGAVVKALTRPLVTVLTFNIMFSMYHLPVVHDFVMTHYTVHSVFFFVLLIAAFMMWWPIIEPIPQLNGLSELKKMGYIFANGVLITPACAMIIFADTALFATYNDPEIWAKAMGYCIPAGSQELLSQFSGPQFFAILGAQEDQQLGGVIMKILQEITYGAALAYIFFSWYSRERAKDDDQDSNLVMTDPIA